MYGVESELLAEVVLVDLLGDEGELFLGLHLLVLLESDQELLQLVVDTEELDVD